MNKLLLLLLSFFLLGFANASKEKCNCGLTDYVEEYLVFKTLSHQNEVQVKDLSEEEIVSVRNKLCVYIHHSSNVGFEANKFNKIIFEALDISHSVKNESQIISDFFNKYNSKLICPKEEGNISSRDLHIFKTAVFEGVIDLFDEILLDEDHYQIGFNTVEMVGQKKETLVDFIDKLLMDDFKNDDTILLLKEDIIDLGGKRGSEL